MGNQTHKVSPSTSLQPQFSFTSTLNSKQFDSLPNLPIELSDTRCILFNQEILICGSYGYGNCYSYHTIKRKYKYICSYPRHISPTFFSHTVIQCNLLNHFNNYNEDNNNNNNNKSIYKQQKQLILLSFGGQEEAQENRTLIMRYQSVWDSELLHKFTGKHHKNQWVPAPFNIGDQDDNMGHVRALIGGSKKNPLLFFICSPNYINVFDLKSFKLITKQRLPFSFYDDTCFVNMYHNYYHKRGNNNHMIMFYEEHGVSIKYNEKRNIFEYESLPVYPAFQDIKDYAYVCWKDFIVLFGGFGYRGSSDRVYVYSTKMKEWHESSYRLPSPLYAAYAILDQDNKWVHIIGGCRTGIKERNQHFRVRLVDLIGLTLHEVEVILEYWVQEIQLKIGWIVEFHEIVADYVNQ